MWERLEDGTFRNTGRLRLDWLKPADIKVGYRLTTAGRRLKVVDIAIVRHGQQPSDENVDTVS